MPSTTAQSTHPLALSINRALPAYPPAFTLSVISRIRKGGVVKAFVTTTTTSGAHKILAASTADYLDGNVVGQHSNTPLQFSAAAATDHSLQMPFTGSQPSGGFVGDWFELQDVAANTWMVKGMFQAGTTPTTPFSTADS